MIPCPTCQGSGTSDLRHDHTSVTVAGETYEEPVTVFYACPECEGKARQYNFITDAWENPPRNYANEPTREWVEGWDACMRGDDRIFNPYTSIQEHRSWKEGWEAADQN